MLELIVGYILSLLLFFLILRRDLVFCVANLNRVFIFTVVYDS